MALSRGGYLIWSVLVFCTVTSYGDAKILMAKENESFNMSCPLNGTATWWILPNQIIVTAHQPYDDSRITLNDTLLFFQSVSTTDDGTYKCVGTLPEEGLVLKSVKVEVEPELETGDVWKKYQTHFITGMVAAAVVAGVILSVCLVFKFRWRDPSKKQTDRSDLLPASDIDDAIVDRRF